MGLAILPTLHPPHLHCLAQTSSEKASGRLWYLPVQVALSEASGSINRGKDPSLRLWKLHSASVKQGFLFVWHQ